MICSLTFCLGAGKGGVSPSMPSRMGEFGTLELPSTQKNHTHQNQLYQYHIQYEFNTSSIQIFNCYKKKIQYSLAIIICIFSLTSWPGFRGSYSRSACPSKLNAIWKSWIKQFVIWRRHAVYFTYLIIKAMI